MSDELTTDLREVAEAGETPPPVSGAEIRRLAVRRRRRRRTTAAVAGVSAAAALALGLTLTVTLGDRADERPSPAASPTGTPSGTPSRTPVQPEATIDLGLRVLAVDGRKLAISTGTEKTPTPTGRMTVTAKEESKTVAAEDAGFPAGYDLNVIWVLELRSAEGRTSFLAALTYDDKAPGNYDSTSGWIGLRTADAEWLYGRLRQGSVIDVEDSSTATMRPPAAMSPSAPLTRGPEAASGG